MVPKTGHSGITRILRAVLIALIGRVVVATTGVNKILVTLKPDCDLYSHIRTLQCRYPRFEDENQGHSSIQIYEVQGFKAYAAYLDEAIVYHLRSYADVLDVEQDSIYSAEGLHEQRHTDYGLSQISHRSREKGSESNYFYDSRGGEDTFAYVVDSGINTAHKDFEGRAILGYNAVKGSKFVDDNGHGTHVAGLIGSKTYGVAKKCELIAVQVSRHNKANTTVLMEGHAWAINDIIHKRRQGRAVINVSLTGEYSAAHNKLVRAGLESGVLTVTSAGNRGINASTVSPASAESALTVSATSATRTRVFFANWGKSVDLFAPGMYLRSTWIGSDTATRVKSGTSMSAAYVAGLAVYFQSIEVLHDGKATRDYIYKTATSGIVKGTKGSSNLFLYNQSGK